MGFLSAFYLILLAGYHTNNSNALKFSRASKRLTIELLIVADYSAFNKWYKLTSSSDSHSHRVNEAKQKLTEYIGTLVHSSNNVYKSLESHNIYISIKLVDVLVMTSASDSPWTETVKVNAESEYTVDPRKALPIFQPKSVDLQRTIPHDHAMIFTLYPLAHRGGSTFSGYAYTEAECKQKSVSIVQDNEDFYTAQLMAHEIGHSLGCDHDGDGNSCPVGAGYAMEANFKLANKNKWIFSSCSVTAIRNYLHNLDSHNNNCLKTIDDNHPDTQLTTAAHQWYGQVYTLDQQCQINDGSNSYLCRGQYRGDYTSVCLKMFCYDPTDQSCYYIDGGDGTPCGTGKWCMSNECVSNSASQLQNVVDSCVAGDSPGVVYHGRTCKEIGQSHHSDCRHSSVKAKCCHTCRTDASIVG
ncbi:metalloprotease mig-17-like [Mercenaria mercenaria]|uniref:metalloprotease mig-17-like n=1 Tax=Mercenaria mercenaria TaxID=6596 RepID=UPI00234F43C8|nr:metalloprotease mig-17-like [Mercenaria mercenaria]